MFVREEVNQTATEGVVERNMVAINNIIMLLIHLEKLTSFQSILLWPSFNATSRYKLYDSEMT